MGRRIGVGRDRKSMGAYGGGIAAPNLFKTFADTKLVSVLSIPVGVVLWTTIKPPSPPNEITYGLEAVLY